MGIDFSDTTNRDGLIELLERDTNTQSATSSSYPLKVKTNDINEALNRYFLLAIRAGGRFQVDDTNQDNAPVIRTDIVSSQADYTFLVDSSTVPNQILDIRTLRIKTSDGIWQTIDQIDRETFDISSYEGVTGQPVHFDLTGNSVVLYPTPNYNSTEGLELYISRTPVYFLSTDTTKEAGIPDLFHSYLYKKPAFHYSIIKNLPQAKGLQVEVEEMEKDIMEYYSQRNRIEKPRFKVNYKGNNSNR